MPELADYFPHLDTMDVAQLHARRNQLLSSAPGGDFSKLEDEPLSELLAINRKVRQKQSGPPKAKTSSTKTKAIEDLA